MGSQQERERESASEIKHERWSDGAARLPRCARREQKSHADQSAGMLAAFREVRRLRLALEAELAYVWPWRPKSATSGPGDLRLSAAALDAAPEGMLAVLGRRGQSPAGASSCVPGPMETEQLCLALETSDC